MHADSIFYGLRGYSVAIDAEYRFDAIRATFVQTRFVRDVPSDDPGRMVRILCSDDNIITCAAWFHDCQFEAGPGISDSQVCWPIHSIHVV